MSQPWVSQLLARSVDDCVLEDHQECLYSGVVAAGDYQDHHVAALASMDLNKIKYDIY